MRIIVEVVGGKADGESDEQEVDVGDLIAVRERSGRVMVRIDCLAYGVMHVFVASAGASVPIPSSE